MFIIFLLTERAQINRLANDYYRYYADSGLGPKRKQILKELQALDKSSATAQDVAQIIGSDTWVAPRECDQCYERTWDAVMFVHENRNRPILCKKCLQQALSLFD